MTASKNCFVVRVANKSDIQPNTHAHTLVHPRIITSSKHNVCRTHVNLRLNTPLSTRRQNMEIHANRFGRKVGGSQSSIYIHGAHSPSNFVAQRFSWNDGNFLADTLIGMEVHCQSRIVFLDDDLSGLLDSLRTYTTLEEIANATKQNKIS